MRSTISIAMMAATLSPLFVVNPVWAVQQSMDGSIVIARAETEGGSKGQTGRDKSYPGWEGFQPFGEQRQQGGGKQPGMEQQRPGEGQQGQPGTEQPRQGGGGQQGQPGVEQQPQGEGQQGQPGMEQQRQEGGQGTGSPGGETGGSTGIEGGQSQ